jgi:hypothetical protein
MSVLYKLQSRVVKTDVRGLRSQEGDLWGAFLYIFHLVQVVIERGLERLYG